MDQILFYLFAATAAVASLLAVSRKNAVASACWLVVMFFGLAAVYVTLEAYFVAAVQILVYAGAIMVLFLFVIMLLDLRSSELAAHSGPRLRVAGVALAVLFTAAVLHALHGAEAGSSVADRVTATLRLPAPAPSVPADPLETTVLPAVPPPVDVELDEVAPVPTPSELDDGYAEGALGERAYAGVLTLPGGRTAPLLVTVAPGAPPAVSIDGVPLPRPAASLADGRASASFPVPGEPGATVDVLLQRTGLEPRAGGGPDGSPRAIGKGIFETWLLPFEMASLLLTGAIFAVVVLTKRRLT